MCKNALEFLLVVQMSAATRSPSTQKPHLHVNLTFVLLIRNCFTLWETYYLATMAQHFIHFISACDKLGVFSLHLRTKHLNGRWDHKMATFCEFFRVLPRGDRDCYNELPLSQSRSNGQLACRFPR